MSILFRKFAIANGMWNNWYLVREYCGSLLAPPHEGWPWLVTVLGGEGKINRKPHDQSFSSLVREEEMSQNFELADFGNGGNQGIGTINNRWNRHRLTFALLVTLKNGLSRLQLGYHRPRHSSKMSHLQALVLTRRSGSPQPVKLISFSTVTVMTSMVALSSFGARQLKFRWVERYDKLLIGSVRCLVGIPALVFHDHDH
ncbi:hypothetical protein Nepgr_000203 [Nepenthes gracilis]|uniref:Uncharacterized protein n=1 Tax=Nepenthes gracilis TaxID=150966 RepID=A0AAD3P2P2_NEPGR|nr:hypothetical protein Nepgr_000203 [Nepenthes gracilis]